MLRRVLVLLVTVVAGVALPFLDAMVPASTAIAQTAAAAKPRLGFFYIPHGAIMRDWTPDTLGADFDFKPLLKPFEEFRDNVTVVLFLDGGDNQPDSGDDAFINTTTTAGGGAYAFSSLIPATYWVAVDSKTVPPNAAFNGGFGQH